MHRTTVGLLVRSAHHFERGAADGDDSVEDQNYLSTMERGKVLLDLTHGDVYTNTHRGTQCPQIWQLTIVYWKRLRKWAGTGQKEKP
jgi:hypothetical protein